MRCADGGDTFRALDSRCGRWVVSTALDRCGLESVRTVANMQPPKLSACPLDELGVVAEVSRTLTWLSLNLLDL